MRNTRLIILLLLLMTVNTAQSGSESCDPGPHLTAWDTLRAKYRGTREEEDVERLWRARVNACEAMQAGRITPEEARRLFEVERQRMIEKWERETGAPPESAAG
ncbi:MAG TPA: hypothetical protein VGE57_08950 [Solimonas sp.]